MATPQITRFFVDAFASALEQGMATPDDVLKHATPDVLANNLPRPLWAKLIAACLAAPRTDAKLVVDTIGVSDLCEHVPAPILWACLAEVAHRALGRSLIAMAPAPEAAGNSKTDKIAVGTSPGTPAPIAAAPTVPSAPIAAMSGTGSQPVPAIPTPAMRAHTEPPLPLGELPPVGSRAPTAKPGASTPTPVPPLRTTGAIPAISTTAPPNGSRGSQAGASSRRPQAQAGSVPTATVPEAPPSRKGPRTAPPSARRGTTSSDFELDTDVSEWKQNKPEAVVVEDDLVDWSNAEETATGGVDLDRKR